MNTYVHAVLISPCWFFSSHDGEMMPDVWDSGPFSFPIGFIGMKTTGKMACNNNNAQHPTLTHYFKAHLELYINDGTLSSQDTDQFSFQRQNIQDTGETIF